MRFATRWTGVALCVAVAGVFALTGCGGSKIRQAKVEGEVKLDGKPIDDGSISFVPADGKGPVAGGKISKGRYSVLVPPGSKRVEVRSSKVVGKRKAYDTPDSPMLDVTEEVVPMAYNARSTLTKNIEMPATRYDLDLKKK